MKRIIVFLIAVFLSQSVFSQCKNTTEYLDPIPVGVDVNDGEEHQIAPGIAAGEYVVISGLNASNEYRFTSKRSNIPNIDYITVRDGSNTSLVRGHSLSPLTINGIVSTTIQIHINLNSGCSTDDEFHVLTIQNLTNATCNMPRAPGGITYKSDNQIDFYWSAPALSTPTGYDWRVVLAGNNPDTFVASGSTVSPTTNASTGAVLSAGTSYWIYVRSTCSGNQESGWFKFPPSYITNTVAPPANDFCEGAISILQELNKAGVGNATAIQGTLAGGAGTNVDAETCNTKTGNARDDIWYKFIAQTDDIHIYLDPTFDGVLTLYSGDCNALNYIACSDNALVLADEEIFASTSNGTGLTIGEVYYLRVYFLGTTTPVNPTFDLKLWSSVSVTDNDSDGYADAPNLDCNDGNPSINPGASEIPDNGIDEDCDGADLKTWYLDSDGDGYGNNANSVLSNTQPTNYVSDNTDCNDGDETINPGSTEICDGKDNDCDGLTDDDDDSLDTSTQTIFFLDNDNDGFGDPNNSVLACNQPVGYVDNSNDICLGFDDNIDTDGDNVPDGCDTCPLDVNNDSDGDGVCDSNDNCPNDANKTDPGVCGCGVADMDTDNDGVLDCNDQELNSPCPNDVNANGVSNDTDGDGTPNCHDGCPSDPNKTSPGVCGCGLADTDTDNDGVLDCNDQEINSPCPNDVDANGVSNDTDGDGTPNCQDTCPSDPNKTSPGNCGCGVADMDTDGDGVLDCNDQEINSPCPNDVNANGVSNDTDGDGTPNCQDGCPSDPNKTSPGNCGCGVADVDTDNDGVLDCNDQEVNSPCPNDVNANGVSNDTDGDGTPNCQDTCDNSIDSDGDGTNDCDDLCPANPNKTDPGVCGCGVADADTDNDGVLDCNDQEVNSPCPNDVDANGVSNDSDGDGTPNCQDGCPSDPNKTSLGVCGCGVADADTDNDGVLDCNDQEVNSPCPNDVNVNGVSNDTDGDGTPNCQDTCPSDPNKTSPGVCGCGLADTDTDNDGVLDCNDQEINSPCSNDVDANGVSNDTDGDGTPNCQDTCPSDPNKTSPGICGCGVADTDTDNDGVLDCNDQEINSPCPNDVNA
ncbi:hypothetical protein ACGK9U_16010, partial [Mariniflexile sp. HNIBRBA6329]